MDLKKGRFYHVTLVCFCRRAKQRPFVVVSKCCFFNKSWWVVWVLKLIFGLDTWKLDIHVPWSDLPLSHSKFGISTAVLAQEVGAYIPSLGIHWRNIDPSYSKYFQMNGSLIGQSDEHNWVQSAMLFFPHSIQDSWNRTPRAYSYSEFIAGNFDNEVLPVLQNRMEVAIYQLFSPFALCTKRRRVVFSRFETTCRHQLPRKNATNCHF